MENKNWIVGLIALIIIVVVAVVGFNKMGGQNKNDNEPKAVSGVTTDNYFADDAKVMYFYSDGCSWCIKEKEVLGKLGAEGYRVKSMNVGNDPSLWETYKVSGTPTFIAENGDRLEGYQTEDKLKPFLDAHK